MKERIAIAMSGGVDSSTAAAILKEEGYDVVGVNMQIWNHLPTGCDTFGSCCSPEDVADARRVAEKIGIPFYVIDLEEEFKKYVVDYFVSGYGKGLTPNPCIWCNKKLKFDELMIRIKKFGADKLATGHYASIVYDNKNPILKRGLDKTKDQSYFLFNLTREQLKQIIMPLGNYTKTEIRKIAKSLGLSVAEKKESQEICFIPDNDYASFIKNNTDEKIESGDIVTVDGDIVGTHSGIVNYTIGQRKGLGISNKTPLYVVRIDNDNNKVIVGNNDDLQKTEFFVEGVNWIIECSIGDKIKSDVQIRYRHSASNATIEVIGEHNAKVVFSNAQRAIAPGQAAVFYNNREEVIGGGWISEIEGL